YFSCTYDFCLTKRAGKKWEETSKTSGKSDSKVVLRMVVGCANKCIKYTFFFFNFLFFVFGGTVCGLALLVRFDNAIQKRLGDLLLQSNMHTVEINDLYLALYIIASLGLVLFVLGFFGCCGAFCEQLCVIGLYFTVVAILFVVELAGAIYLLVNKENIKNSFINTFRTTIVGNYYKNQYIRQQLDLLQSEAHCCGATGCTNYQSPPPSCGCVFSPQHPQGNVIGCAVKIVDIFENNIVIIIVVAAAIFIVELIALIFSCIICSAVREQRNVTY
ncbi:CD9 antigen, partial [Toxocara canis]